jgi:hypothetical protein
MTEAFQRIRDDCYDALGVWPDTIDVEPFLEDIFALVTNVIRARFGLTIERAEFLLRDARNEADRVMFAYRFDNLVDLDQTIKEIAEYLADKEQEE